MASFLADRGSLIRYRAHHETSPPARAGRDVDFPHWMHQTKVTSMGWLQLIHTITGAQTRQNSSLSPTFGVPSAPCQRRILLLSNQPRWHCVRRHDVSRASRWAARSRLCGKQLRSQRKHPTENRDFPYWRQAQFEQSLEWNPDIVVIMLGTNDSKTFNWVHADAFVPDFTEFVRSYQEIDSQPRVLLATPTPLFGDDLAPFDSKVMSQ